MIDIGFVLVVKTSRCAVSVVDLRYVPEGVKLPVRVCFPDRVKFVIPRVCIKILSMTSSSPNCNAVFAWIAVLAMNVSVASSPLKISAVVRVHAKSIHRLLGLVAGMISKLHRSN